MYQSLTTLRYAKALYQKAEEENLLQEVLVDIRLVGKTFTENAELDEMIHYPFIYPSKKKKILNNLFGKRIQAVTLRFLFLIIENKRDKYIKNILRNFVDVYNDRQGIKTVTLTTAIEIGEKEKDSIKSLVKKYFYAQKVDFRERIDKEIIGGFILQIEDQLLDASVRRQLEKVSYTLKYKNHIV
ncbi:MAG: ATP synthase F1 subunit delta [Bacteroidales bacterium]|nr:ATP synthase F1 subunit delta [Bacteroidales bacterium]